jgi:hypothetical protein
MRHLKSQIARSSDDDGDFAAEVEEFVASLAIHRSSIPMLVEIVNDPW